MTTSTSPFSDDPSAFDASMSESERLNLLIASADEALKVALKEWNEVSKSSAETARCLGCEKAWRDRVLNIRKSVVMSGLAVAAVKNALADGEDPRAFRVEAPEKGYHEWWVVPKVLNSTIK